MEKVIKTCSALSLLSYETPEVFSSELRKMGLKSLLERGVGFYEREGAQMFVVKSEDITYVVFRGTEILSMKDIKADMSIFKKMNRTQDGRVHSGFYNHLEKVWDFVPEEEETNPIVFTGHSLGGAMATLACSRVKSTAVTFGSPRVGNLSLIHI